jgi:hypothetical protein
VLCKINNHGFARGFSNLTQTSDDDSTHQPSEIWGNSDRCRKKEKHKKVAITKGLRPKRSAIFAEGM